MQMQFREFTADDLGLVEASVELTNAVRKVDSPWEHPVTVTERQGEMRYGWDLEPGRHFAGLVDGQMVAMGVLYTSEWDNRDLAWLHLYVHPDHRRRGVGTWMLERLVEVARAMGRTKLGADAWDGSAGVAFAERHAFTAASRAVNRRQHLDRLDQGRVRALYDEAAAAASAYELIRITGATPEDMIEDLAAMTAAINDAPLDDLDMEDEVFPPQRVRDYEQAVRGRSQRLYRLVARHRESGELAGHTAVAVDSERPEIAHQHDTAVVRAHRGHRLGLLLKAGMVLWLGEVEPQLRTIDTWNAESNDHMVGVNEQLGYEWLGREIEFQRRL